MKFERLEEPLNSNERYLHGIAIRLDALIHMMSSFMEVYANQNKVSTTSNKVVEKLATVKSEATEAPKSVVKEASDAIASVKKVTKPKTTKK